MTTKTSRRRKPILRVFGSFVVSDPTGEIKFNLYGSPWRATYWDEAAWNALPELCRPDEAMRFGTGYIEIARAD
jgi:hypothetical protein